jgi:hypothetical protein
MAKVRLSESQLRRIIYEELIDHYLVQKKLWDDEPGTDKHPGKVDLPVKDRRPSA